MRAAPALSPGSRREHRTTAAAEDDLCPGRHGVTGASPRDGRPRSEQTGTAPSAEPRSTGPATPNPDVTEAVAGLTTLGPRSRAARRGEGRSGAEPGGRSHPGVPQPRLRPRGRQSGRATPGAGPPSRPAGLPDAQPPARPRRPGAHFRSALGLRAVRALGGRGRGLRRPGASAGRAGAAAVRRPFHRLQAALGFLGGRTLVRGHPCGARHGREFAGCTPPPSPVAASQARESPLHFTGGEAPDPQRGSASAALNRPQRTTLRAPARSQSPGVPAREPGDPPPAASSLGPRAPQPRRRQVRATASAPRGKAVASAAPGAWEHLLRRGASPGSSGSSAPSRPPGLVNTLRE